MSAFHHLEVVRDLGYLAEHDRGRAVFFGRQVHRLFDAPGVERAAGDGEMDVDLGEDLGVGIGARGIDVGDAVGDLLAALPQDVDDVEGGAAAQAQQQHFHRAHAEVFAAGFGGPSMTTLWPDSLWPTKLTPSKSGSGLDKLHLLCYCSSHAPPRPHQAGWVSSSLPRVTVDAS